MKIVTTVVRKEKYKFDEIFRFADSFVLFRFAGSIIEYKGIILHILYLNFQECLLLVIENTYNIGRITGKLAMNTFLILLNI